MGNVIVAALLIVGAGAAATIVVITQGPSLTTGIDSVFQSQRTAADRIRSHIDIVGVNASDSRRSIDVWLKNTGDVTIDAVSNIDLILKWEGPGGGAYITHGASTGSRWSAVAPVTEVVNPEETLHVRIMLDEPVAPGVHTIRVNTPRGSAARETFEVPTAPTPPSNQLIAFTSFRDGNAEIYSIREDGTDLARLTVNQAGDWKPAWSPAGDKIAFHSDRDGNLEIYVMNADGSGQTRLTQNAYQDEAPTWSRDGSQIAFQSNAGEGGNYEIFVMDSADGANRVPLTESGSDVWQTEVWQNESPRWSPESVLGDQISFSSYRSQRDIYITQLVTPPPGSTPLPGRKLTDLPTDDGTASWSSDGRLMVLESRRSGDLEIFTVNADGTNPVRLTHDPGNDRSPSWSRDTTRIVFESDRTGNRDIYIMDSDGTDLRRLTRHSAHDESPAWAWAPE